MIFHCGWTDAELVFTCRQLQLRPAPLHQPTSCVFHLSANQLLVCSRLQHLHLRAQWFPWQCQMTAYSYHSYTSGHGSNHSCHYHGNCRGLTVGTMVRWTEEPLPWLQWKTAEDTAVTRATLREGDVTMVIERDQQWGDSMVTLSPAGEQSGGQSPWLQWTIKPVPPLHARTLSCDLICVLLVFFWWYHRLKSVQVK